MIHVIVSGSGIKVKQSLCLCRALGDQLEGNEEEHEKYRDMTIKFIRVRVSLEDLILLQYTIK